MQTIRARLSLNYLLVLILGMTLAGALAWLAVERLYIDTQRENLLAQARLIATALEGSALPAGPSESYSQTSNVAPGIHTRLLSDGGAVIVGLPAATEFTQAPAAEQYASVPTSELIQRPEISAAQQGTPATATRRILGDKRVLYAAAPVYAENGEISGVVYIATPLPVAGLPTSLIWQLIGAILVAVVLATFFGGLLAQKIARPLEKLAGAADSISHGNLNQHVETKSRISEIQRLSNTFNDMAENLRQSEAAKKAFIADVTHELRTPLTVIKGTIETLEDGALDDVEGRGPLLTSMQRETDRLIRLVNELLVLTRADAGALQLNMQTVDLVELVEARCVVLSGLATRRGITFAVKEAASETPAIVLADPDRISQVIDNLLNNAIRHSPEKGTITFAIEQVDNGWECCIIDQGSGIPAEHLPFIFERFYRVDSARSRNRTESGTGLGLAIAKELVDAHGGHIGAQSSEGNGTIVKFWLPGA